MNASERQQLKQLANNAIIRTFGSESSEQRLAEALEKCVDQLDYVSGKWRPTCQQCNENLKTYDEELEDGEL